MKICYVCSSNLTISGEKHLFCGPRFSLHRLGRFSHQTIPARTDPTVNSLDTIIFATVAIRYCYDTLCPSSRLLLWLLSPSALAFLC